MSERACPRSINSERPLLPSFLPSFVAPIYSTSFLPSSFELRTSCVNYDECYCNPRRPRERERERERGVCTAVQWQDSIAARGHPKFLWEEDLHEES